MDDARALGVGAQIQGPSCWTHCWHRDVATRLGRPPPVAGRCSPLPSRCQAPGASISAQSEKSSSPLWSQPSKCAMLDGDMRILPGTRVVLGIAPQPGRLDLELITVNPARALHAALANLHIVAGKGSSLTDALAVAGGPLTSCWQHTARGAVALEQYHDVLITIAGEDARASCRRHLAGCRRAALPRRRPRRGAARRRPGSRPASSPPGTVWFGSPPLKCRPRPPACLRIPRTFSYRSAPGSCRCAPSRNWPPPPGS
jgi:hypothetical protein